MLYDTRYGGGFPSQATLCDTSWVSYNLTQFWHALPGDGIVSHRWRTYSSRSAPIPLQIPIASPTSHLCFWPMAYQLESPKTPTPLGLINVVEWLIECRARSEWVLITGASVPVELGWVTLPVCGCAHQLGSSPNPVLLGFLRGFLMQAGPIVNSISSPFLLLGGCMGGWTENSKLNQGHPIRTKDTASAQELQELCVRDGGQTPNTYFLL